MIFNLFSKSKKEYEISEPKILRNVVKHNRKSLSLIKNWLPKAVKDTSYFQYGVPDEIFGLLNKRINSEETYSDLILYYSRLLPKVNYLELGVSVGKNFFQVANYLNGAELTGFDIEDINPVLESKFTLIDNNFWPTIPNSIRKETSTLKTYEYLQNKINYLAGDIWDEASWEKLKGEKFSIIFSDALHTPEALKWEYKMIMKYELLANEFIFFWDDLNTGLELSFEYIADALKKSGRLNDGLAKKIKINGWLGQNYPIKHDVGIITNLRLK